MIATGPWATLATEIARRFRDPRAFDAPAWHELWLALTEQPECDRILRASMRRAAVRLRLSPAWFGELSELALLAVAHTLRSEQARHREAMAVERDLSSWLAATFDAELGRLLWRWRRHDGYFLAHATPPWALRHSRHAAALHQAAAGLPDPWHTVLLLSLAGWSMAEIGAELHQSEKRVRQTLRQALRKSRKQR